MSSHHKTSFLDMAENESVSAAAFLFFFWPASWLWNFSKEVGRHCGSFCGQHPIGKVVGVVFDILVKVMMFVCLYLFVNLVVEYMLFAFASVYRLLTNKGGRVGLLKNSGFLVFYLATMFLWVKVLEIFVGPISWTDVRMFLDI